MGVWDNIIGYIGRLIKSKYTIYNGSVGNKDESEAKYRKDNVYRYNYRKSTDADVKEELRKLIKDNEKYFVAETVAMTKDAILHKGRGYIEDLKTSGYYFRVIAETFEKYGIFMYINDLYRCTYAPEQVKRELGRLILENGLEKVAEEIAIYMKENHSEKFGIRIVCTQ